ncbi:major facilitator superfamily domain-containing protein 6 [Musca domestica]|uniref:Major facilitator superfamily domain-containing protein 6 n=1 Tax=Musca domestica TaxID=7370 RepID=A0A1I8MUF3_MUSDO|nr:major facilitator superfamily domain-containing protein 6 [Musca domestica]XP_058982246.1 major facilitator superfamily domain-containing protein 6 [Musca domestica]XP_058982247.1 major facilitator superfamily domain-containing protein 6 [Musca domestica]
MAVINKRLLPIKAHFFFFMAAMGPILPQLSVIGKQIGIAPEVMGYITCILPVMYVIAKPMFGFIADYFSHFRKFIFISLIVGMTLSYACFYFIPENTNLQLNPLQDVTMDMKNMTHCREELMDPTNTNISISKATCTDNSNSNFTFPAYFLDTRTEAISKYNLTSNYEQYYICLGSNITTTLPNESSRLKFNGTCQFEYSPEQSNSLYLSATFWIFVILMCCGTIGFNVTNSISDAICFDMLGDAAEHKYGNQRVWGTIGFGLTALISGVVVDLWTVDTVKSFTPALVIMLIFSAFDLMSVSKLKLPKLSSSESITKDVWQCIKQPAVATFLVFATIAGIIDSFIIFFLFWHVEEVAAETGYMDQIKLIEGCVVAAECLAGEVPFFFYSGKIIKKLGYVHCMSMCFFFYAVRLGLISWIPNPWYLVGVELFFQGCTYALCYTVIVAYASEIAPPGTSATIQGLIAGMDDGLGFSIGSLIGGLAFKRFHGRRSFMYFSILAICTCVAHIVLRPASKKRQYLPKTGYQAPVEQEMTAIREKEEQKSMIDSVS